MNPVLSCPERESLERLVLGLLPPSETEPLARHLEACGDCATAVSRMPLRDTLTEAARHLSQREPDGDVRELTERLKLLITGERTVVVDPGTLDSLAPGQDGELGRLGNYRLLRLLGSGGMGLVFEAEDVQLSRRVALKALHPELARDPSARERFLREARAVAGIEHDHIVAVHHVGEDRGVPFLVMPLLRGISLEERLRRDRRLSGAEVVHLGQQIALGLAAAHEHGLVHRDIKPANLWIEDEPAGHVRILDFGLVRLMQEDARTTRSGTIVGTPAYMAPEQAAGGKVDPRCDLFALGCVLYHMATGQPPFKGENTLAVLASLASNDPPPVRDLAPELPSALGELIMELLAKEPAKRPASAAEVAQRLEEIEHGAPGRRRRRYGWLVAAAVLLVLVPAAWFLGGPVVRFAGNKGVLVVEIDDPDVELTVRQGDVTLADRSTKREFVLAAGDGEVEVCEKDGVKLATRQFQLTRGGKSRVTVTWQELAVARKKGAEPVPAEEAERRAAVWALSVGGKVRVRLPGKVVTLKPGDTLPEAPFTVLGINLVHTRANDEGMKNLRGLSRLETLDLNYTEISDEGMQHLAGMTKLSGLTLGSHRITDAGIEHIKGLTRLTFLNIGSAVGMSDEGVAYLSRMTELETLLLGGQRITDAGVSRLTGLSKLRRLGLNQCKVTGEGLKPLQRLPELEVLELSNLKLGQGNFAFLRGFSRIKMLSLAFVDITDADLEHLKGLEQLEGLDLLHTPVNGRGLSHLKGLRLAGFRFQDSPICDDAMSLLPGMLHPLQAQMGLDGTKITDRGLERLGQAFQGRGQHIVSVRNTGVTAPGIAALKKACPNWAITSDFDR